LFSTHISQWLENALDAGISEADFWNMTLGEVIRAIESRNRIIKIEAKERAAFDYTLADLIGKSVSRIHSSANKMPEISEVYPSLFNNAEIQEQRQAKRDELSALRFKQFAKSYNKKFEEVAKVSDE
jgi:hypothetical protein